MSEGEAERIRAGEPEPARPDPEGTGDGAPAPEARPRESGPLPDGEQAPPERDGTPREAPGEEAPEPGVPTLRVVEVGDLDWEAIRSAAVAPVDGRWAEAILDRMEDRLAGGGPLGLAFEESAGGPADRALLVTEDPGDEVWFVGDLHGDRVALEAALQVIGRGAGGETARIVFLGDLFDDGRHAAGVVLRVFELILQRGHWRVTVVAGNHDVALRFEGGRFTSSVLPSDFTDWLNARPDHPWAARLGRAIESFFERAPRAIFFPDGLLAAHGGVPHTDLHPRLEEGGSWNDPEVLQDFVWLRAHPRARRRIPNRTTRGAEFGREDFEAFCDVATRAGRPVARMIRGHDHVEERFALFDAYRRNPILTINTMSHRLPREVFGPYERVPVVARWIRGELPEVHRIHVPPELIREVDPEPADPSGGSGG